jgi:PPOX class probable F420-dependent enzyme
MSLLERVAAAQSRFYDRIRHPAAGRLAAQPPTAAGLAAFEGHRYCLFVSFRRSGEPVPTPVLFGVADGKLYLRSDASVAKLKRIARDPRVAVAPCNWRGKPRGPLVAGSARILPASEEQSAYAALDANYTRFLRLYERTLDRFPIDIKYVEVTPVR